MKTSISMATPLKTSDLAHPLGEELAATELLQVVGQDLPERKQMLVRAAAELMAERGLDGVTLRGVLQRSGLARRAFYESFASKDELLMVLFAQTMRVAADFFEADIADIEQPIDRIRFVVERMTVSAPTDSVIRYRVSLAREHLRLAETHPAELQRALQPLHRLIADQLREGMQRGDVRRDDPDRLAMMVQGFVTSVIHATLLGPAWGQEQAVPESVWEFCRRAITADDEAAAALRVG